MNAPYWFDVAVIFWIFAVGNILFGHFEEQTPKWRRVLKACLGGVVAALISTYAGRVWFYSVLGVMSVFVLVIHGWWLPRNGINGWTAEPKDKYYAFRGWKLPIDKTRD